MLDKLLFLVGLFIIEVIGVGVFGDWGMLTAPVFLVGVILYWAYQVAGANDELRVAEERKLAAEAEVAAAKERQAQANLDLEQALDTYADAVAEKISVRRMLRGDARYTNRGDVSFN